MHSVETGKVVSLGRAKRLRRLVKGGLWHPKTYGSQTATKKKVANSSVFPEVDELMSEQCNANEVDKKLSKLSFRDKGIGVGFGSIKH